MHLWTCLLTVSCLIRISRASYIEDVILTLNKAENEIKTVLRHESNEIADTVVIINSILEDAKTNISLRISELDRVVAEAFDESVRKKVSISSCILRGRTSITSMNKLNQTGFYPCQNTIEIANANKSLHAEIETLQKELNEMFASCIGSHVFICAKMAVCMTSSMEKVHIKLKNIQTDVEFFLDLTYVKSSDCTKSTIEKFTTMVDTSEEKFSSCVDEILYMHK